jgi:histidinol dehydrogenase
MYCEQLTSKAQRELAATCALLARMEGLEAHARAAEIRTEERK